MLSYLQVQGSFPGYMNGILLRRSLRSKPTSILMGSGSSTSPPSSPSLPSPSLPSPPSSLGSSGLGVGAFFLKRDVKVNKSLQLDEGLARKEKRLKFLLVNQPVTALRACLILKLFNTHLLIGLFPFGTAICCPGL